MRKLLISFIVATTALSIVVAPASFAEAKAKNAKAQKTPAIKCKPTCLLYTSPSPRLSFTIGPCAKHLSHS